MTNNEGKMWKKCRSSNPEKRLNGIVMDFGCLTLKPSTSHPVWSFEFTSSFVIRASSFSHLLADHLLLLGARVSLLSADQTALIQFDQSIIHQAHALLFAGLNNAR